MKKEKKEDIEDVKYSVEKIENGYVITKNYKELEENGGYNYESKKYFSKENPFKKEVSALDIMKASVGEE